MKAQLAFIEAVETVHENNDLTVKTVATEGVEVGEICRELAMTLPRQTARLPPYAYLCYLQTFTRDS
jgi:hypothetical protein